MYNYYSAIILPSKKATFGAYSMGRLFAKIGFYVGAYSRTCTVSKLIHYVTVLI